VGIRLGAWDYLKWKHITPLIGTNEELLAARIIAYAGDPEEYYAFKTPEAYNSLKSWMEFRSKYGEEISGDSWLLRDIWQTSNMKYGAKFGLATNSCFTCLSKSHPSFYLFSAFVLPYYFSFRYFMIRLF